MTMQRLQEKEFVIFDVETTGLSPSVGDRIIEIAALKTKGLTPVDRFHTLINPGRLISSAAFEVNRISDQMVAQAPKAKEVLPDFLTFAGRATLVGHNVRFDLGFLYHELEAAGLRLNHEPEFIDTMHLARRILPDLRRYPLWLVADALGITKSQKHRAMADVELTFEVFCRLADLARDRNVLEEFFL